VVPQTVGSGVEEKGLDRYCPHLKKLSMSSGNEAEKGEDEATIPRGKKSVKQVTNSWAGSERGAVSARKVLGEQAANVFYRGRKETGVENIESGKSLE